MTSKASRMDVFQTSFDVVLFQINGDIFQIRFVVTMFCSWSGFAVMILNDFDMVSLTILIWVKIVILMWVKKV